MRQMMVRAFLLVILAQLNPVTSKEDSEKTNFLPSPGHDSYGLQNKADIKDSRSSHPAVYCDRESLIIEISPTQRTDFNLIIDDKPQVFVKHVLEQCSHVELQPSSTFRIFYEGCYLHDWVAHKKQYTVTIGHPDSNLKGAMVISETCPSLTSGALLQIPAVTCAADATIVKLPAKT
ncbi:uncharacterized protein LOC143514893 [Brachyhypopomus gauderio]|uniref:uncharacterized protein LOC143514893 n=1 Tax=Brachyhypopomus gauderio TaxID=698409 RepID=UPI004043370A